MRAGFLINGTLINNSICILSSGNLFTAITTVETIMYNEKENEINIMKN